jgi:ABC-type transporter Mla subunit MlaD
MNDWDGGGMDNNLSDVVAAVNNDIDDFSDTLSGNLSDVVAAVNNNIDDFSDTLSGKLGMATVG